AAPGPVPPPARALDCPRGGHRSCRPAVQREVQPVHRAHADRRSRGPGEPRRGARSRPPCRGPDPDRALAQDGPRPGRVRRRPGRDRFCAGDRAPPRGGRARPALLPADQAVIEPALEKAEKRARGKRTPEVEALAAANAALQAEIPLSDARLSEGPRRGLKPIAPLTIKPSIVVANLEEGTDVPEGLPEGTVGVYASIEAETAEMEPAEARALLDEFGVHEPGLETVIRAGYRAIDLITFLTTGDDETRAWEVRSGAKAPEAAGVIHTDLER